MNITTHDSRQSRKAVAMTAMAFALLLAACAPGQLPGPNPDTNVLTIEHAFSDEALADAAGKARRVCADRKQLAIQTQQACTLTRCRTSFQCIKSEDKAAYGL